VLEESALTEVLVDRSQHVVGIITRKNLTHAALVFEKGSELSRNRRKRSKLRGRRKGKSLKAGGGCMFERQRRQE
jgi:hypothetical protein